MAIRPDRQDEHHRRDLRSRPWPESRGDQVEYGAEGQHGEVQGGEVVMQEELTLHEEEGEVVERPANDQERADFVVICELGCEKREVQLVLPDFLPSCSPSTHVAIGLYILSELEEPVAP